MSATHLAAPYVQVSGRIVQRCAVCGLKLCDNLRVAMPLRADGLPDSFPTWAAGALVRIDGNRKSMVGHWDDATRTLPADFCLPLVEE